MHINSTHRAVCIKICSMGILGRRRLCKHRGKSLYMDKQMKAHIVRTVDDKCVLCVQRTVPVVDSLEMVKIWDLDGDCKWNFHQLNEISAVQATPRVFKLSVKSREIMSLFMHTDESQSDYCTCSGTLYYSHGRGCDWLLIICV